MTSCSNDLISSPQSKNLKVFDMSSSPLPSLSDLVMNVKAAKSSDVMIIESADNLPHTRAKSEELAEVQDENNNASQKLNISRSSSEYSGTVTAKNSSQETSYGRLKEIEITYTAKIGTQELKPKEMDAILPNSSYPRSQTRKNATKAAAWRPSTKEARSKTVNKSQMCFPKGKVIKPHSSVTLATKIEKNNNEIGYLTKEPSASVIADASECLPELTLLENVITESVCDELTNNRDSSDHSPNSEEKNKGFSGLFGKFGYKKTVASSQEEKPNGGIRKGKLIELMNSNVSFKGKVPKKHKADKKKAKTITDQAISVFSVDDKQQRAPLSDYFPLQTVKRTSDSRLLNTEKKGSKSSSKSKSKSFNGNDKSNTISALLSPSSALKQVDQQDFVFGTSSQLAQEDSPTLLREIHEAMQVSNHLDDPFASSPTAPSFKTATTNRNLWTAASRDIGGTLLDVETIDLAESQSDGDIITSSPIVIHDNWQEITSSPFVKYNTALPNIIQAIEMSSDRRPLNGVSIPEEDILSKKAPTQKRTMSKSQVSTVKVAEKTPNFNSYTNAQLAKEIAAYHFKPVKKREQMITLLQQCWEGKKRMKAGVSESNDISTNVTMTSSEIDEPNEQLPKIKGKRPKSVKGRQSQETDNNIFLSQTRKRKKSTSSIDELTEFSDSDTPNSSSRCRKLSKAWSPTPSPCLSNSESTDGSSDLSSTTNTKILFTHITQAIKTTASSKDSSKPSWHEKILLYDPIVLEDLTAWLNMGALQQANWDREVELKDVKKWCESQSICCLWRESLRNGSRNRY